MDTRSSPSADVAAGPAAPADDARSSADSGSQIRLAMPVFAAQGGKLGTLAAWHLDPLTRRMNELTVRHGFLGRKHTRVLMGDITRVSDGKLVLAYSSAAFKLLPGCEEPAK
jgi:hypothetical protein